MEPRERYPVLERSRVLEGYPVEPKKDMPDVFAWTGLAAAFEKAGFVERAPRVRPRGRSCAASSEAIAPARRFSLDSWIAARRRGGIPHEAMGEP